MPQTTHSLADVRAALANHGINTVPCVDADRVRDTLTLTTPYGVTVTLEPWCDLIEITYTLAGRVLCRDHPRTVDAAAACVHAWWD